MKNYNLFLIEKKAVATMVFFLLMFVMLLAFVPCASSLGITPGRTTINFKPGLEQSVVFSVLNNEHKNMQVLLTVQGELNKSVALFENLVSFMPSEESKQFNYTLKLGDKLEAGLHTAEIIAIEIPKSSESGTYVGATVAVVSQIFVYVPCPGKCIEADLNVLDAEQNSTATFIVPVVNRGKLDIGDTRAIIEVYTSLNEKVATIETDSQPIKAGERTELSGKWSVNVNSGSYIAKATVFYDGESREVEKQFAIGKEALSIESIIVNDFTLGEIAKLRILVENKWNQELKSVFANLLVYNNEHEIMADVKSASEGIPALSKKELIAYWDTVGVAEGEYDGKLIVNYDKKSTDKNLILSISEGRLDITGVGYAIKPRGGSGVSITTILLILVIILLVVNLAWFVFFRRILGRNREKESNTVKTIRVK
jgi:hypothetical protein